MFIQQTIFVNFSVHHGIGRYLTDKGYFRGGDAKYCLDKFQIELNEGILDVLRNLIPPLHTEEQFCGLIKGTYIFFLMYYLDELHHFRHLDPSNNLPFSFSALQNEFRVVAKTLSHGEKKVVLSSSILFIDAIYQSLTLQPLPVPKWVNSFREFTSRLFPHFRTE